MKTIKISISILLILTILLSCLTAAFAAGNSVDPIALLEAAGQGRTESAQAPAAKSAASVAAAEAVQALLANKTNINAAPPTDAAKLEAYRTKLALYEKALSAYKALTQEEKDAFPVEDALKFLAAIDGRESYLIKEENPALAYVDQHKAAYEKLDDLIGPHAARTKAYEAMKPLMTPFEGTTKLNANTDFAKKPAAKPFLEAYLQNYKNASPLTRQYMDGISAFSESYGNPTVGGKLADLIKMMGNYALAADPFTEQPPASAGTAPNANNFPGGASDPEYIAALNEWLPKKLAEVSFTQRQKNHAYRKYFTAMEQAAAFAPEYAPVLNAAIQLREGYVAFLETGATNKAAAAVAAYDAIEDAYLLKVYKSLGSVYAYYEIYLNSKGNNYNYSNLQTSQLYKKCLDAIEQMQVVRTFEAYVANVDLSTVNNGVIEQAQAEYKKIPVNLTDKISAEAMEKYRAILALYDPVKPLVPSDNKFEGEIASFNPTTVNATKFPCARKAIEYTILNTDRLLGSVLQMALAYSANGTLKGYQNYSILSNASMSTLLSLYDMLANMELSVSGINIAEVLAGELTPTKLAGWLSEDSFAGARAKLLAAAEAEDTTAAFASIQFENGDWGFENGDAEGFARAVAAMLRPIANVLHNGILIISNIIYLPNSVADNGDYKYGAYEKLIPLLESLGLKGVLSSQEYTSRFQAAAKVSNNAQLDALFLPIVSPIVTLVEELQANPLNTMLDLLPRLARTISTNTLNDSLNGFLHSSSLLGGVNIDLSGDAINAMIDSQKINISLGDNAQLSTTLKAVDWARLAGCGKLVLADSVSASNAYRTVIESDRANAYVVASQYLIKTVLRTRIEGKTTTVALGI